MSSGSTSRRVSRGRQRIPLSRIENETHRQVTFSKRRSGVFKKASELVALCGVEIGMVVFSPASKAYTFGNPSLSMVLNKYFAENPTAQANLAEELLRARHEATMRAVTPQISDLETQIYEQTKINQAFCEAEKAWPSISDLQLPELESMKHRLEMLRSLVYGKLRQPTMQVQTPVMTPQFDRGGFFGSFSPFGNIDGAGPSGAGPSGAGPSGAGPSGAGPSGAGPSGAGPSDAS